MTIRIITKKLACSFLLCLSILISKAQTVVKEPKSEASWTKSYPPFRIAGDLYYVGTYDLACYLVTSPKGHILINTGLAASAKQIKSSVERLGFKFADIKILLTTQAHFDHMGAMSAIKKMTGAALMVDEKDADVVESGGRSDYELGKYGTSFQPMKPDRLLKDHDTIRLGDVSLEMLHHPGHTKGSCSFLLTTKDQQQSYRVLIANMPTIITDRSFKEVNTYPEIESDYAHTLRSMKSLEFDLWLASHASQFNMHEKHTPGDRYNPGAFRDREGYELALRELEDAFKKKTGGAPAH
jgi:metallo-beta-lactamase class B